MLVLLVELAEFIAPRQNPKGTSTSTWTQTELELDGSWSWSSQSSSLWNLNPRRHPSIASSSSTPPLAIGFQASRSFIWVSIPSSQCSVDADAQQPSLCPPEKLAGMRESVPPPGGDGTESEVPKTKGERHCPAQLATRFARKSPRRGSALVRDLQQRELL